MNNLIKAVSSRRRTTRAQLDQLDSQIVAVLSEEPGQSARHVFYRMTDPTLPFAVPKTENAYRQVQGRCVYLRRAGTIPYEWITDATRAGEHTPQYAGAVDFIHRVKWNYRGRLWTPSMPHVDVWAESRSIGSTLSELCRELSVSLYCAGGFCSETLIYDAAQNINRMERDRAVILYIGDYDPAGVLIDRDIERKMMEHLLVPLTFHRLAINEAQITEHHLPTKPRKDTDRRRLDIAETVEAEAMLAGTLRGILRTALEAYIPEGALEAVAAEEELVQAQIEMMCDREDEAA